MKKITFLTFLLITGLAFGQEEITDGGFESIADGVATNGTTIVQGNNSTADGVWQSNANFASSFALETTDVDAGTSALILDNLLSASQLRQNLTLTPNTSYVLTFRAKLENSNTNEDQTGDVATDKTLVTQLRADLNNVKQTITTGTLGQLHNGAW